MSQGDGREMVCAVGTVIINENELSRKMYMIKQGKARVYKTYFGQKVMLAILGEGEVFGELSFFDGEPRSASVEALTELTVTVFDGEKVQSEVANLPPWVVALFKRVFARFRDADHKLMILQSMYEFQKKNTREDNVARSIYIELVRTLKAFSLLHEQHKQKSEKIKASEFYKELDDLLASRLIGFRVFWRLLREQGFIDNVTEEENNVLQVDMSRLQAWNAYLLSEVKEGRFLLLGHPALAILRRIFTVGAAANVKDLSFDSIPLHEEGLEELRRHGLVRIEGVELKFEANRLLEVYRYQTILKAFDHTTISLD